jgi:branched-chain amino acid aminotransferase
MRLPVFTTSEFNARLDELRRPWHRNYLSMYATPWGGIVTDPVLMTVPVDDHLVHRGDGVFDVFLCLDGKAYCLEAHLARLERSAAWIGLKLPEDYPEARAIFRAAAVAGKEKDVCIRTMVSRGPGGFSADPYECSASQLYVIVFRYVPRPAARYEEGVVLASVSVPVKPSYFAQVKSCDYLLNALVKKEAADAGADFGVTWDDQGFLAEGATENILLVSAEGELLIPTFDRTLRGTTLMRLMVLAEDLVREGVLVGIRQTHINRARAGSCVEVMLCGTTLHVMPVREWDGRKVGQGKPGPVARRLRQALLEDMRSNDEVLTPLF